MPAARDCDLGHGLELARLEIGEDLRARKQPGGFLAVGHKVG
jgi:hypothetical protein